jgi:hypothetical protein
MSTVICLLFGLFKPALTKRKRNCSWRCSVVVRNTEVLHYSLIII